MMRIWGGRGVLLSLMVVVGVGCYETRKVRVIGMVSPESAQSRVQAELEAKAQRLMRERGGDYECPRGTAPYLFSQGVAICTEIQIANFALCARELSIETDLQAKGEQRELIAKAVYEKLQAEAGYLDKAIEVLGSTYARGGEMEVARAKAIGACILIATHASPEQIFTYLTSKDAAPSSGPILNTSITLADAAKVIEAWNKARSESSGEPDAGPRSGGDAGVKDGGSDAGTDAGVDGGRDAGRGR